MAEDFKKLESVIKECYSYAQYYEEEAEALEEIIKIYELISTMKEDKNSQTSKRGEELFSELQKALPEEYEGIEDGDYDISPIQKKIKEVRNTR